MSQCKVCCVERQLIGATRYTKQQWQHPAPSDALLHCHRLDGRGRCSHASILSHRRRSREERKKRAQPPLACVGQHERPRNDGRPAPERRIKNWDRGWPWPAGFPPFVDLHGLGSDHACVPDARLARHMTASAMRTPETPRPRLDKRRPLAHDDLARRMAARFHHCRGVYWQVSRLWPTTLPPLPPPPHPSTNPCVRLTSAASTAPRIYVAEIAAITPLHRRCPGQAPPRFSRFRRRRRSSLTCPRPASRRC